MNKNRKKEPTKKQIGRKEGRQQGWNEERIIQEQKEKDKIKMRQKERIKGRSNKKVRERVGEQEGKFIRKVS